MLTLKLLWRGEIDLPVTFWGGCIFLNLILIDRAGMAIVGFIGKSVGSLFLLRFYTALVVVFNCFILPSLWRSARNWQGEAVWSRLTKVLCILLGARVIYTFISLWYGNL